jgi:hypothetical protein
VTDETTPTSIETWLKEEARKREREVQEAQRELDRAEDAMTDDGSPPSMSPLDLIEFLRDNVRPTAPDASPHSHPPTNSPYLIGQVCDEFRDFLVAKNHQYGDSAIDPVRIFSKADAEEQLKVRMDDKLSRLVRGNDALEPDEDIIKDLLGYWILLQVVRRKAADADSA